MSLLRPSAEPCCSQDSKMTPLSWEYDLLPWVLGPGPSSSFPVGWCRSVWVQWWYLYHCTREWLWHSGWAVKQVTKSTSHLRRQCLVIPMLQSQYQLHYGNLSLQQQTIHHSNHRLLTWFSWQGPWQYSVKLSRVWLISATLFSLM